MRQVAKLKPQYNVDAKYKYVSQDGKVVYANFKEESITYEGVIYLLCKG